MIKIKNSQNSAELPKDPSKSIVYEYKPTTTGIPNAPNNLPVGMPVYTHVAANPVRLPEPPPIDMPEANLPRSINYYADYGGCGFWRMIWPEFCLNAYNKSVISGLTCMVLDLRFYQGLKTIRMQRQATPVQNAFIKELVKAKPQMGYKMVYEVDDIVFKEDIPDYNRCKDAFVSQDIANSILEIMGMMDEVTVTCQYMKDYYIEKTGNKKITVIPNYPPKFWLDRFYNKQRIEELYDKHKKRPRVLYAGSGTHIDVTNRTGMKDDFSHVIDEIIKARKKFKFVWKGCYPLALKPFIDNGEMEYVDWSPLMDLPKDIYNIGANVAYAPLVDNIFNKSKSNIKMIEAGALGMPGAYQDLCTYKDAEIKFDKGSDLISKLEYITSDFDRYMGLSERARKFTEGLWLEDHLDEYDALYNTDWGSKERNEKSKILVENNPEQRV
jgi:hypothetical protein